jgi:D-alanine--poly(phosphoribitol) ligase subunit 1
VILENPIINNVLNSNSSPFILGSSYAYKWNDAKKAVFTITNFFKSHKIKQGDIIAIDSNKDFYSYVTILACYCNGISFSPLNFDDLNKTKTIPDTYLPKLFLSTNLEHTINNPKIIHIESELKRFNSKNFIDFISKPIGNSIAYIMQSSGSTGEPKVIPISYSNLESYLNAVEKITSFKKNSVFSQIVNLTFDLSIHDMFLCFRYQGSLLPLKYSFVKLAARFIQTFNVENIMLVPSFLDQLVNKQILIKSVRNLFFCGEALHKKTAILASRIFPNASLFNFYGPTETTVAITYFKISNAENISSEIVPIGNALPGSKVKLNKNNELLLYGPQVFSGYLNHNDKNPFYDINKLYYLSGDKCTYDGDNFNFVSRVDFQIKYRGYRIELEGIEAILSNSLKGEFAAIGYNQIVPGNYWDLIIFFTNKDLIHNKIMQLLPAYLSNILTKNISHIPKNQNGKIDREALTSIVK